MFSDLDRQTDRVVTALVMKYTQTTSVLGVNWSLNIFYMHNYYIIIYLIRHSIILNSTKTKIWILYAKNSIIKGRHNETSCTQYYIV